MIAVLAAHVYVRGTAIRIPHFNRGRSLRAKETGNLGEPPRRAQRGHRY